jgi:hypothetical protein
MRYGEISIVETPNTTSRAIAAADRAALRYRRQLAAAFLPAAAILVAAADRAALRYRRQLAAAFLPAAAILVAAAIMIAKLLAG